MRSPPSGRPTCLAGCAWCPRSPLWTSAHAKPLTRRAHLGEAPLSARTRSARSNPPWKSFLNIIAAEFSKHYMGRGSAQNGLKTIENALHIYPNTQYYRSRRSPASTVTFSKFGVAAAKSSSDSGLCCVVTRAVLAQARAGLVRAVDAIRDADPGQRSEVAEEVTPTDKRCGKQGK